MPITYSENYTVQAHDIDENKHMNNVRYVVLIQEISKRHWYNIVNQKSYNDDYYWVVINHNINYRSSALLNEELIIETFVEKIDKLYSYRRVIVKQKTSGKECMNALTKWCLISAETRRVCRIPEAFIDMFMDSEANSPTHK